MIDSELTSSIACVLVAPLAVTTSWSPETATVTSPPLAFTAHGDGGPRPLPGSPVGFVGGNSTLPGAGVEPSDPAGVEPSPASPVDGEDPVPLEIVPAPVVPSVLVVSGVIEPSAGPGLTGASTEGVDGVTEPGSTSIEGEVGVGATAGSGSVWSSEGVTVGVTDCDETTGAVSFEIVAL